MGWEARENVGSEPRGNPKPPPIHVRVLVDGKRTAIRHRKLRRPNEVVASWAHDNDPVRQP